MSDYKCRCGNEKDFFIEHNLSMCGLYCGSCGKWQKWLNKDEERLFKHKQDLAKHNKTCGSEMALPLREIAANLMHELQPHYPEDTCHYFSKGIQALVVKLEAIINEGNSGT